MCEAMGFKCQHLSICGEKKPENTILLLKRKTYIQVYLGDTEGSVPDRCNKANIVINWSKWFFWFPSAYEGYVHTVLWFTKCAIPLCLKIKKGHTLIKKCFIV